VIQGDWECIISGLLKIDPVMTFFFDLEMKVKRTCFEDSAWKSRFTKVQRIAVIQYGATMGT
jgi:hypothetical protein